MGWVFHDIDPMGGAAGEAYANTLKSPGMRPEHVLAREAIQNSVDAGRDGLKVAVTFRRCRLEGAQKEAFIHNADLGALSGRKKALDLATPNCLVTLDQPNKPIELLFVEDYNAEGLSGDPHDNSSNFYRLLLSLGDRSKARSDKGTGGSYGFGKSVYSSSSAIQTIFAYTRFIGPSGDEKTRIFGCGYYQSHEFEGKSFSGRAWFGAEQRRDDQGRRIVDPLEGEEADSLASKLGFAIRGEGALGTTILIVDSAVLLGEIISGVEDWWWPRLVANKLDVEAVEVDGAIHVPRPKKQSHLRQFIEAFEIATGTAPPKTGTQKLSPLNRLGELNLGVCGFVVVPMNDQGVLAVPPERCNAVALIRAPLMVVAYKSFSDTAPYVVGAFMADEVVNVALKKSEPPAHDRWDPDSANLRDIEGIDRNVVKAIVSRIGGGLRRFQGEAAPPPPPRQRRLTILERALGTYFRPSGAGRTRPPESAASPIHLEFTKQPHPIPTTDGQLHLQGAFNVFLDSKVEDDVLDLRMRLSCPVLEDEGQEGEDLSLSVESTGVTVALDPGDPGVYHFSLSKGAKAHFAVVSEPYDASWTVRFRPEIDGEVAS